MFLPKDGQVNPIDVTQALAVGRPRARGEDLREHQGHCASSLRERQGGGRRDCVTAPIRADKVVIAGGMWSRDLGRSDRRQHPAACLRAFLHRHRADRRACHATCRSCASPMNAPTTRRMRASSWSGPSSPRPRPWGFEGIDDDHAFETLPEDMDHFEPILTAAINRVPLLETAGIQLFFNGPESFTPDVRYYLGEAPEVKDLFIAAGFNSIGIQSSGGAGSGAVAVDQERPSDDGRQRHGHPAHPSLSVGEALCRMTGQQKASVSSMPCTGLIVRRRRRAESAAPRSMTS